MMESTTDVVDYLISSNNLHELAPEDLQVIIDSFLDLWNDITNFYINNLELEDERVYHILTAFTVATYFAEHFPVFPYVHFYGQPKSGKTRAETAMSKLCNNSIFTVNCSIPALFRMIKENGEYHTIFFDEFTLPLKAKQLKDNEFLQILNVGYKKGAVVIRCEKDKEAEDGFVNREFDVDGFKVLSGTDAVPRTLSGRCITIDMYKTKKRFPLRIDEQLAKKLQNKVWAFAFAVNRLEKKEFYTITDDVENLLFESSGSDGRLVELFTPLYVIAPEKIKPTILEYIKEIGELEIEEELASYECEIFQAIMEAPVKNSWFSTKSITDIVNKNRASNEQIRTYSVGRQLKQFGFKPFSKGGKTRGWKWDKRIIEKLKLRFPVVELKQQKLNTQDKITMVYDLFVDRSMLLSYEDIVNQINGDLTDDEIRKILTQLLTECKIYQPDGTKYAKV